jgi:hypothetical protein
MTTMKISRRDMDEAVSKMKANGWNHVSTLMVDDRRNKDYGLLFARGDRRYWMNIDTWDSMPND